MSDALPAGEPRTVDDLFELARRVVRRARALGADEVSVSASRGTSVSVRQRDERVEQATEATTRGLVVSMLVGDRFTSNSTSDLRPSALESFLARCAASTRWLEPDPCRRLPEPERVGRGVPERALDQDDPAWAARRPEDRLRDAAALAARLAERSPADRVSRVAHVADGRTESVRVATNGFEDRSAGAWFSCGGSVVLADGDKRPEGGADYAARHLADLPGPERIATEAIERARQGIGSRPIPSGVYPMLLENRVAGRLLSMLQGPLSGGALHQRRSCLLDRQGTRIASPLLDLTDDPTIPRGMGSRPWDGEALVARPFRVIADGVLENAYISLYHSRKLGVPPTTGGRSNWVLRPGTRPFAAIARDVPRCVVVTGFLGGNANASTGDFSYGIRGLLLEHGAVVASLSEMNVAGNLLTLLADLGEVGNDPWTWGSVRSPALFWPAVVFSGS